MEDPSKTTLILGDMAELGKDELSIHVDVLIKLKEYKIFVTGNLFKEAIKQSKFLNVTYFHGLEDFPKQILVKKLGAGERPKVTVKTLEKTGGGRGDGANEVLVRRASIAISGGTESKSARIKQLKVEQRKLRTKIANARQKGKDDKAAAARIKQLTTMINKLK